jgi:hypothetical protein
MRLEVHCYGFGHFVESKEFGDSGWNEFARKYSGVFALVEDKEKSRMVKVTSMEGAAAPCVRQWTENFRFEGQAVGCYAVKCAGLELRLGVRQFQLKTADGVTDDKCLALLHV